MFPLPQRHSVTSLTGISVHSSAAQHISARRPDLLLRQFPLHRRYHARCVRLGLPSSKMIGSGYPSIPSPEAWALLEIPSLLENWCPGRSLTWRTAPVVFLFPPAIPLTTWTRRKDQRGARRLPC